MVGGLLLIRISDSSLLVQNYRARSPSMAQHVISCHNQLPASRLGSGHRTGPMNEDYCDLVAADPDPIH